MRILSGLENSMFNLSIKLDFILRFIPRLVIGAIFIPAGWAKLNSLSQTINYFKTLNIPLAMIQAPLVSLLELVCGFLILIGFYTRLACVPLIAIMAVAIMTAHKIDVNNVMSVIEMTQGLYIVILLNIFCMGSGTFSIEQMFFRKK